MAAGRWRHWPAHWWNGLSVALGVMLVQAIVSHAAPAALSHVASQLAMACAICASLADLPGSVRRNRNRVLTAGAMSLLAVSDRPALLDGEEGTG